MDVCYHRMCGFATPKFRFFEKSEGAGAAKGEARPAGRASLYGRYYDSVKVILTGLWSDHAKPVSSTVACDTVTLGVVRKPSTVRTYCPS